MELNKYQEQAGTTAEYPGKGESLGLYYAALGLGEAGEVQNEVKKVLRNDNGVLTEKRKNAIIDEAGDVLWYLAALATEVGVTLQDIAELNLKKLAKRKEEDTIKEREKARAINEKIIIL
jgi:NTP pyrophosphatase (non-canonical NTP hydrolase)